MTEVEMLKARIAELESVAAPGITGPKTITVDDPRELRLDLGCGETPRPGFTGVDKHLSKEGVLQVDLLKFPWPWEDSSVDALSSSHFIEHIPMCNWVGTRIKGGLADFDSSPFDLVEGTDLLACFFNEAFRVAKPGATFELQWPALKNVRAFQDPTHRRFIPLELMSYWSKACRDANKLGHYLGATCDWIMISGSPTISTVALPGQLLADSQRPDPVQAANYREHWDFSQDLVCTLKAAK